MSFVRYLPVCVLASCLASSTQIAFAHGPAPAALSVVASDAAGPCVVRLTGGLATREHDGFYRMVCPAIWGSDLSLPALGLPDGPVVVLGATSLFVLTKDGRVAPHPDPNAQSTSFDIAAVAGHVYVLRTHVGAGTGSEIVEVTADHVRAIWSDPGIWTSLAGGDSLLAVATLSDDDQLRQIVLSVDGAVKSSQKAAAPTGATNVTVRTIGDEVYLVAAKDDGRELGQLVSNAWVVHQSASAAIAGPIATQDGVRYIAVDSQLSQLQDGDALAPTNDMVTCLGRFGQQSYACTRDGLRAVGANGLDGPALFDLSRMLPPDRNLLAPGLGDQCDLQWQHFRFDLLSFGITLVNDADGGNSGLAGTGGVAGAAAGGASGSVAAAGSSAPSPAPTASGGCSALTGRTGGAGAEIAALTLLALASVRRRKQPSR
jgi:hypothetical protein